VTAADARTALPALWAEVLDDPADEGRWLIFADACADAGADRAAWLTRVARDLYRHRTTRSQWRQVVTVDVESWTGPASFSFVLKHPEWARWAEWRGPFLSAAAVAGHEWQRRGREWVRLYPLVQVEIYDARPLLTPQGAAYWSTEPMRLSRRLRGRNPYPPTPLPSFWFDLLPAGDAGGGNPTVRRHVSETAARRALSAAVLAWARQHATGEYARGPFADAAEGIHPRGIDA